MIIGSLYRVGGRSLDGLRDIKVLKDGSHAPLSRFFLFQSPIINLPDILDVNTLLAHPFPVLHESFMASARLRLRLHQWLLVESLVSFRGIDGLLCNVVLFPFHILCARTYF